MRSVLFISGLLILAFAWMGPLPEMAAHSFSAHMTLHMLIVAVIAPLLSFALAGLAIDPVRHMAALFSPIPASVGELLIVWAWHAPWLHHFARNSSIGFALEQTMFLAAGVWVWLSAFGGTMPRSKSRAAAGVVGLLLTSMHMTLLGALLALAPRLLFNHHHSLIGLSPLQDQHLGGAVMLVVGGIAYLAGGLWLTVDLANQRNPNCEALQA
ncbi:cytochrome c oxidase assembly protein [Bythopirellula goksoeyrii]|uniref:Cytochrome c oxidase caa3 assembly factor (Caa3_CtaG) n=1 Tax=Bythopirellula goksoeyrii TaxID=1400387 RepID=A0A5B9QG97_9BACT|nr:cytochrome c oxidase assembly protein [Bythopirellula goksoeyrii]QEG33371.1 Cytochrome c oxidase caa3 assembly factor (Caa3_CtaG) [Bythopirellula goksoeyrii]